MFVWSNSTFSHSKSGTIFLSVESLRVESLSVKSLIVQSLRVESLSVESLRVEFRNEIVTISRFFSCVLSLKE